MKRFFETTVHSTSFLLCVPIGFLIAMGLANGHSRGWIRFVMDCVVLASGALGFFVLLAFVHEDGMRSYHILGAICGALMYLCGFFRLQQCICRKLRQKPHRKYNRPAGKEEHENEKKKE